MICVFNQFGGRKRGVIQTMVVVPIHVGMPTAFPPKSVLVPCIWVHHRMASNEGLIQSSESSRVSGI